MNLDSHWKREKIILLGLASPVMSHSSAIARNLDFTQTVCFNPNFSHYLFFPISLNDYDSRINHSIDLFLEATCLNNICLSIDT
jgi:hypothetical protein